MASYFQYTDGHQEVTCFSVAFLAKWKLGHALRQPKSQENSEKTYDFDTEFLTCTTFYIKKSKNVWKNKFGPKYSLKRVSEKAQKTRILYSVNSPLEIKIDF